MLSEEIVDDFLSNKLKLPHWRSKVEENKFEFLKEIVLAHASEIYFQNVTWSAVPKPQRKIPTIEEVIHQGANGLGGACIHLNYFLKLLLEFLNYDVFIVGADCPAWETPRSHMATVVRLPGSKDIKVDQDENESELYLVDVGFGARPFLEPISLNKSKLPYIGKAGGFTFEYRFNQEKNVYERLVHDGCPIRGSFEEKPEKMESVDFYFNLTPLTFDDFPECHKDLFSSEGTSQFLDFLLVSRLINVKSLDDYEYINFRNLVLIEGTKTSHKETAYESYDDLLPALHKYFPKLDSQQLQSAFFHYVQMRQANLAENVEKSQ